MCTKAEFSSSLFKISANLVEGQRPCKFCILQDENKKKKQPRTIKHYPLSQFANAVTFLCAVLKRTNFRHLHPLCVWMKAIISAVSRTSFDSSFSVPESPGCSPKYERHLCFHCLNTRCQILPECKCAQAFTFSRQTHLTVHASKGNECDDN